MGADAADMLASTLVDAQVDLNPHQVEAALFAFHSPLSKGVILAEEVGLGKTIEAGLVIAQRWTEHRHRGRHAGGKIELAEAAARAGRKAQPVAVQDF